MVSSFNFKIALYCTRKFVKRRLTSTFKSQTCRNFLIQPPIVYLDQCIVIVLSFPIRPCSENARVKHA